MITSVIFAAHIFFMLVIFTKKWQEESFWVGIQNVSFIIILFSVGWPLYTMIGKIFVTPEGLGINCDRDSIILSLLTISEYFFYKFYYKEFVITEDDKEK